MSDTQGFPNGHLLWTAQQLHDRLGDENLVILDVRSTHQVVKGFIPGAAHLDVYGIGLTSTAGPLFEEFIHLLRSQLGMRGVGMDKTVLVYEERSGMRAARVFWLLEYMGHTDVHVLDGGIAAWEEAGYQTTLEMKAPRPHSLPITPQARLFISADDLAAKVRTGAVLPLDTRTDDEHYGRNTRGGPRGGTIPGAVHLEWTEYLDEAGRFKPAAELAQLFESNGVTRDKAIVPF